MTGWSEIIVGWWDDFLWNLPNYFNFLVSFYNQSHAYQFIKKQIWSLFGVAEVMLIFMVPTIICDCLS